MGSRSIAQVHQGRERLMSIADLRLLGKTLDTALGGFGTQIVLVTLALAILQNVKSKCFVCFLPSL